MIDRWTEENVPCQLLYHLMQERCAPRIMVDRGNTNYCWQHVIERAESMWSDARYIYVTRHPYDVLRSGVSMFGQTLKFRGVAFEESKLMQSLEGAYILSHLEAPRGLACVPSERQLRTSYEDIMDHTEPALRQVCDMIGVPFDAAMLNPYQCEDNAIHAVAGESGVASRDPKLFKQKTLGRRQPTKLIDPLAKYGLCCSPQLRRIARQFGYQLSETAHLLALATSACKEICAGDGSTQGLVVCVAGSDENYNQFKPMFARLEQWNVVALDFDAMPRNDFPTQAAFFAGHVKHLVADFAPGARLTLVGYSSGSALAHELALACRPFLAEAQIQLVLVDRNPWNVDEVLEASSNQAALIDAIGRQMDVNGDAPDWPQRRIFLRCTVAPRIFSHLHAAAPVYKHCAIPVCCLVQVRCHEDVYRKDYYVPRACSLGAVAPRGVQRDRHSRCDALRHPFERALLGAARSVC